MKNKTYDILKVIALKVLPALEFLVITIFKIWNLPYGAEIGATIAALDTALGIILGIASKQYYNDLDNEATQEEADLLIDRDDE